MGGGDGTIIVRNAMKRALSHPLVHGQLPEKMTAVIDPVLAKDEGEWTLHEHHAVLEVFNWAAQHS